MTLIRQLKIVLACDNRKCDSCRRIIRRAIKHLKKEVKS